eukprot:scaffold38225_cov59-Phaeocystis_antarctica.AAC.1
MELGLCLEVDRHARPPYVLEGLLIPLAHPDHRGHRADALGARLELEHAPRQPHRQLALEEARDLNEGALPAR